MDIHSLPKVELHCHVRGMADSTMLHDMRAEGWSLPVSPEALEALSPVADYDSFWRYMNALEPFEGSLDAYRPIIAAHVERLKAQHVIYTEIALGTSELPRDPGELSERFRAFRDWLTHIQDGELQVELLVGFSRRRPATYMDEVAPLILSLGRAGLIVGVMVAGPEEGYPVRPFRRVLQRFREAGLGVEIHAGEWAGPESVWDAIDHGNPDRLGHGVAVFDDPRLVERIQDDGVHLELCPTSNVRTGSIRGIDEHPVRRAKELGLSFSVNTDNPGAIQCSMESEFRLLETRFGFGERDFKKIARDSLNARFQPVLRIAQGSLRNR